MSGEGGGMQHVQVLPAQNSGGASGQPIMLQSQVIQMMVPGSAGGSPTIQQIPLPGKLHNF